MKEKIRPGIKEAFKAQGIQWGVEPDAFTTGVDLQVFKRQINRERIAREKHLTMQHLIYHEKPKSKL